MHVTDKTDLSEIEAEEFYPDKIAMFDFVTGMVKMDAVRGDYRKVIEDAGFSENVVRMQSECKDDRVDVDIDSMGLEVRMSVIEGRGVFVIWLVNNMIYFLILEMESYGLF